MGRPKKILTEQEKLSVEVELPENTASDLVEKVKPEIETSLEKLKELDAVESEDMVPAFSDAGWHDYVMKQFVNEELYNGNPTTDSMRRVVEKLIGEIVEGTAKVIQPVQLFNGRLTPVTVEYTVKVKSKITGTLLSYTDAADVFDGNAIAEYARHATAVATTRAEGRVLRKLLKLRKVVSAEEAAAPKLEESSMYDKIREDQVNFVDRLCQRNNINVMKYVNMGSKSYVDIYDVPFDKAVEMLAFLSGLQNKHETIPEHIKGYDAEWKNKKEVAF